MGRGRKRAVALWVGIVSIVIGSAAAATWNVAFEALPANSESVGLAASRIRDFKSEVRNREETEHDFGNLGNVTTDTGRHLAGSARIFVQSSAPSVDGTTSPNCLVEADVNNQRFCEAGREWLDSDDNRLYVSTDAGADGDADAWQSIKIDAADVATGVIAPARLDATATPTANKIPIADGTGKLNSGWITFPTGAPVRICKVVGTLPLECTAFNNALYGSYRLIAYGNTPMGTNGNLGLQVDSSGGASYDSGAFDYALLNGSFDSSITLTGSTGVGSFYVNMDMYAGGSGTGYPLLMGQTIAQSPSGFAGSNVGGSRNSLIAVNAVRLINIVAFNATVTFEVYGLPL